jgi:hypothetical protein
MCRLAELVIVTYRGTHPRISWYGASAGGSSQPETSQALVCHHHSSLGYRCDLCAETCSVPVFEWCKTRTGVWRKATCLVVRDFKNGCSKGHHPCISAPKRKSGSPATSFDFGFRGEQISKQAYRKYIFFGEEVAEQGRRGGPKRGGGRG